MTINTEKPLHILAANLWSREGGHCVSHLVSTLAQGLGTDEAGTDLADLINTAFELACPIDDWESAASEAGYLMARDGFVRHEGVAEQEIADGLAGWMTFERCCQDNNIEPHQTEVYEHWIVSDWLADKLAELGEKVEKDFAGLTIWARTTTGQAVHADHVIETIAGKLHASVEG